MVFLVYAIYDLFVTCKIHLVILLRSMATKTGKEQLSNTPDSLV